MVKLVYDENSIINAKENFKQYSENIISSLEKINTEFQDIDKILNTPKANKLIPVCIEEFKNELNYLNETKDSYDNLFDAINNEYHEHVEEVRGMVGSDYEA